MKFLRKLSTIEKSLEMLNRTSSSFNVITISKVKGYINPDDLTQALKAVTTKYISAQVVIHERNNQSIFYHQSELEIPLIILKKPAEDYWQQIVINEANQLLDSQKHLIRVKLVHQEDRQMSYLITTIHHIIVDGLSSIKLHSEILKYCGNPQNQLNNLAPIKPEPFSPIAETLFPDKYRGFQGKIRGFKWFLKFATKQFLRSPKTLDFEEVINVENRTCDIVYRQIESDFTNILIDRTRTEQTTIQSVLCAAMLLAVDDKIRQNKLEKNTLICRSFVDLRRRLSPPLSHSHLGFFASGITTFHDIFSTTEFWELAREVKQQIEQGILTGEIYNIVLMFEPVLKAILANPNKAPLAVEVTNAGKINIPVEYGELYLEEIRFLPSQGIFGGIFFVAVTTINDRILLNFVFSEPSLSKKTIEELAETTINIVTNACSDS